MFHVLKMFIIITVSLMATQVIAKESLPYLLVTTIHNLTPVQTLEVSLGQNVSLYCIVHPNNHSVLWQTKYKQKKPTKGVATLNILKVRYTDLGVYTCESPSSKIKMQVSVVLKKRHKREIGNHYDELQKRLEKLLEYHAQTNNQIEESFKNSNWNEPHIIPTSIIKKSGSNYKHTAWTHFLYLTVAIIAFTSCISILTCICRRDSSMLQIINPNSELQPLPTVVVQDEVHYIEPLSSAPNPNIQLLPSAATESPLESIEINTVASDSQNTSTSTHSTSEPADEFDLNRDWTREVADDPRLLWSYENTID